MVTYFRAGTFHGCWQLIPDAWSSSEPLAIGHCIGHVQSSHSGGNIIVALEHHVALLTKVLEDKCARSACSSHVSSSSLLPVGVSLVQMYSVYPFALATGLIEMPYILFQTVTYSAIGEWETHTLVTPCLLLWTVPCHTSSCLVTHPAVDLCILHVHCLRQFVLLSGLSVLLLQSTRWSNSLGQPPSFSGENLKCCSAYQLTSAPAASMQHRTASVSVMGLVSQWALYCLRLARCK